MGQSRVEQAGTALVRYRTVPDAAPFGAEVLETPRHTLGAVNPNLNRERRQNLTVGITGKCFGFIIFGYLRPDQARDRRGMHGWQDKSKCT